MYKTLFLLLIFLCLMTPAFAAQIDVARFSQNTMQGWEPHSFKGHTQYQLIQQDGRTVLKAFSQASASGLIKKQQIDLKQTPYLNWSWKIDKTLYRLAETFKEGDDFAARIYVVVDGGVFFWRTLALNYVWSSSQKKHSMWDNPFTSNAKMIAIESGNEFKNQWRAEKRNVFEDLKTAFHKEVRFIDAIAIMTDTDNSGQSAIAYYGDIYFTEK